MKSIILTAIILVAGCKSGNSNEPKAIDTTQKKVKTKIELPESIVDRAKYHTDQDTVYIYDNGYNELKFSKEDFNDIVDNFPELTSLNTIYPDSAYNEKIWVDFVDSLGNKKHLSFGSEAGQDEYYILYAYFLKNRNGIEKYSVRRKKLHEIYITLNNLFGTLSYGGTYFGHQYYRIEGYTEFSLYWFNHYEDFFDRPYDITKQKAFYIGGLRQMVSDEVDIDPETWTKREKEERKKLLDQKIDILDTLITDNFYLRMAQSFQSDHY